MLFADLVNSTGLAAEIDAEDLHEAVRGYHRLAAEAIERHGGAVLKFLGDGVLGIFGRPMAHEDDAERAVRAGLAIAKAMAAAEAGGHRLEVRIGIATDVVIAGEVARSGEDDVIGQAPNLASRLQGLAPSGSVVISARTRRLIGDLFRLRDLGEVAVKGLPLPVRAWEVLGEAGAGDRFVALHGQRLLPMVGRGLELALLEDRWGRVRDGEGQVVLLSGEAGIGKSRLLHELLYRLRGADVTVLTCQCSPHLANSALAPFIGLVERAGGLDPAESPEARRERLQVALAAAGVVDEVGRERIAELLGLRPPQQQGDRRVELLDAFARYVSGLAGNRPLLLAVEDLHWADPTSIELTDRLVELARDRRLLIVLTFRPDFPPRWTGLSHVTSLSLVRLSRRVTAELVQSAMGKALPEGLLAEIVAKTDGVPLFAEELARSLLESGVLADAGDHFRLARDAVPLPIPATLQDSLIARLDRLPREKRTAQTAACIGREVAYPLLAAVANVPEPELAVSLDRLVEAGVMFRRGSGAEAIYAFKHALVQDAAYASLLRRARQRIHARIAERLESDYRPLVEQQPELLARHLTEARIHDRAVAAWEAAGRLARAQSASREAAAHFRKAIEVLALVPAGPARHERELALWVDLGAQLIAAKGNAAPEVEQAFSHAEALSAVVGETPLLFRALRGLQTFHLVRGSTERAAEFGTRLLALAERAGDPDLQLQAHRPHGLCLFLMGRFQESRTHLSRALALYDPERHASHRFDYGSDPGVLSLCNLGWLEWFLGLDEEASAHSGQAIELARRIEHQHSLAFALGLAAALHQARGDPGRTLEAAEETLEIGLRSHFPYWAAWGRVLRGWADGALAATGAALDDIDTGLRAYAETGAEQMQSYFLSLRADQLLRTGDLAEARETLERAIAHGSEHRIEFHLGEAHRLRAVVLAALGRPVGEIGAALDDARAMAERQHALAVAAKVARTARELRLG